MVDILRSKNQMRPDLLRKKRSRVWTYAVLIAICCVGGIAASWFSSDYLARSLVMTKILEQSDVWQHRVLELLEDNHTSFRTKQLSDKDAATLSIYVQASEAYRIVLFDDAGVAFWSTKTSQIGSKVEGNYFQTTLRAGSIYSALVTKKPEQIDDWLNNVSHASTDAPGERYVAEIYVPVIDKGAFLGAIEHYYDVTDEIGLYRSWLRTLGVAGSLCLWLISGIIILQLLGSARQREADLKLLNEAQSKAIANEGKRSHESRLLSELNEWLQSCRSLDELYDMVATFMGRLMPHTAGSLYIYANSRDVLDGVKSWNNASALQSIQPDDCWGLRRGRTYTYGTNEIDFVCSHIHDGAPGQYSCIPIVAHGETIGLLHLAYKGSRTCGHPGGDCKSCAIDCKDDERRLAFTCAEQISLAIANVRLRDQLRDQSIRDPLTGLFNRRYMTETCRREIARARRSGEPICIMSIDIDHFKRFNDNHGHDCGDAVLRAVGDCLRRSLREDDVACRHGGEEFVLIMPATTPETGLERAEEIRKAVEDLVVRYSDGNLPRITISVGVADFPRCGSTTQELLKAADSALYAAKAAGRNQVHWAKSLTAAAKPNGEGPPQPKLIGAYEIDGETPVGRILS